VKAVVLVGGEGTRLRPLTETMPKPLLPLVDRSILDHVLDHLLAHGIWDVLMSSPYLEHTFHPFIEARGGEPAIAWVTEREPLGTGGAIVSVMERLGHEPFFALNGDVLTDLDLTAMLASHRERGAAVTIASHRVKDARAFGLVVADPTGRITEFREKPADRVPGDINAGTYVLEPSALRSWPVGTNTSIEKEIFPKLIRDGAAVIRFDDDAYWLDLGTPEQYLRAHVDLLEGRVRGSSYPAPWIGAGASLDPTARVGRTVAIGRGASVGSEAQLDEAVLMAEASVEARGRVERSIVGARGVVGEGATLVDSVLGEGVVVPAGVTLEGVRLGSGTPPP
jgi:mannose-1-phosphate guanylyltransferase